MVGKSKITRLASIPSAWSSLWTTRDHDCLAGFELGTIRVILKIPGFAFVVLVNPNEVTDSSRSPSARVEIRSLPSFDFIFACLVVAESANKECAGLPTKSTGFYGLICG